MTAGTPLYQVIRVHAGMATVEIYLPDFHRGEIVMKESLVHTPTGDAIVARELARYQSTQDMLRGEI